MPHNRKSTGRLGGSAARVAMASTLAGDFTLVGSIANLIVVERARALGVRIGFWTYFKVGAPLTLATIALGLWRL